MKNRKKIAVAAGALALAGVVGVSSLAVADYGRGKGGYHGSHHGKWAKHHGGKSWRKQARLMERFDANKDGKLDQAELDQSRKELMERHDANKDGNISLDEFKTLWLEVMERRVVRGFQRLDVDGDAIITVEEFIEPYSDVVERMDRNDDGVLDKEDRKRRHHRGDHDSKDDEKKG